MSEQLFPEDQTEYRRTWIWAVPLLVFLVFVVGQLLVLLPADALGWVSQTTVDKYPAVLFVIVGAFAMVAVLFSTWVKLFERRSMASVGLVFNNRSAGIYAGGYATGLLMGITVVGAIFLAGAYKLETGHISRDLSSGTRCCFHYYARPDNHRACDPSRSKSAQTCLRVTFTGRWVYPFTNEEKVRLGSS